MSSAVASITDRLNDVLTESMTFISSHNGLRGTVRSLIQFPYSAPHWEWTFVYTTEYSWNMRFEWNENKNRSNFKKHGVWFEEAQTIWADSESVELFDPEHSSNEDHFIRIGHSTRVRILLVVFCERA